MELNNEQKKNIIEKAQELYRAEFQNRCAEDPFTREVDIGTFKEACQDMSCLVHYLAEKMYDIPNEENLIYSCEFKHDGCTWSHYFNKICNRTVDSTIMQFHSLSPYDDNDKCYTNLQKEDYYANSIKREIALYNKK